MSVISVCVPVYNTEKTLLNCLNSIAVQSFTDFEIILVDDCSPFKEDISVKSVLDEFCKENPSVKITLIEHHKNKGTLESRRTAVDFSQSEYITFIDSDDEFLPDSLKDFYDKVIISNADIVQGAVEISAAENIAVEIKEKVNNITNKLYDGLLQNTNMLEEYYLKSQYNGYLWGKLYKTSIVKQAFSEIPQMYCNLGEDMCISFYINLFAKSYFGFTDKKIYKYNVDNGITSKRVIKDIESYEKICSVSSVFTVLYCYLNENTFPSDYLAFTQEKCKFYVQNCLDALPRVIPELQEQAYAVLCDYWGESLVKKIQSVHK